MTVKAKNELLSQIQDLNDFIWWGMLSESLTFPTPGPQTLDRLLEFVAHLEVSGRMTEGLLSRLSGVEIETILSEKRDRIKRRNDEHLRHLAELLQS